MSIVTQQKFIKHTHPAWAGDFLGRESVLAGGAQLQPEDFVPAPTTLTLGNGGDAAIGDKTIVVDTALLIELREGRRLYSIDSTKMVVMSKTAAIGDTTLNVFALDTAIVDLTDLIYAPTEAVKIPSGTIVGRTRAERDVNRGFGPAADADEEFYLTIHHVDDVLKDADVDLYRHGRIVYTNFLPDWTAMSATVKTAIYDNYETGISQDDIDVPV